jgi:hypothetical protein
MFNSCSYQARYSDLRREADWLHDLGEYKNFPRERRVKTRHGRLVRFFSWVFSSLRRATI